MSRKTSTAKSWYFFSLSLIYPNIRSHVATILGIVNLREVDEDLMDAGTAFSFIKKSSLSLDETIRNLNEIISIQTNINLPLIGINVQSEIKRIVDSIVMLVSSAGAEINYLFNSDNVIVTNPAYFESIILNLITNSLKYRSADRALIINIDMLEISEYNILIFKDNGIGIDLKKYSNQLFGMYNTFNGNQDAKGMGLFIVKTQVEALKGRIEVESVFGENTIFKIYFPKNEPKQELVLVDLLV